MFVDEAKIYIKGGNGGNGCAGLHREKYKPKGGPDGGDGGRGGNVIFRADRGLKTLLDFQWRRHYIAPSGRHGQGSNKHGRNGDDIVLKVPLGTVIKDESGAVLAELVAPEQAEIVARGGLGGRGNVHFATAKRKAPVFAELGEPGQEMTVYLELKLLADVGLIGYPNVGKSTLISRISAAKPKIADYPFTTLKPNLGVVRLPDDRSFIAADIPGLIEGAHDGKGLGDRFLRHIERTAVLLHLIDISGTERTDPLEDYEKIRRELARYRADLAGRPEIVVGAKVDLPSAVENRERLETEFKRLGRKFICISSLTGEGIDRLLYETAALVDEVRTEQTPEPVASGEIRVYRLEKAAEIEIVEETSHVWKVINSRIERWVKMTDWNNEEAVDYLKNKLTRAGVDEALKKSGAVPGDEVIIADMAFEFQDDS